MPDHSAELVRLENKQLLLKSLSRLREEDATALNLFYFHEYALEEICRITGWSLSNTISRLNMARRRLKNILQTSDQFN